MMDTKKSSNSDLLFLDISARIQKRPIVSLKDGIVGVAVAVGSNKTVHVAYQENGTDKTRIVNVDDCKVCLYPMSALNDDEMGELLELTISKDFENDPTGDWIKFRQDGDVEFIFYRRSYKDVVKFFNWCYLNNYDCNNLIEKDMAIDISELKREDEKSESAS